MLQKLIINNVALIDCAQIEFKNGLNVLSGETGAGKSVIMESLNFVLGAKADRTLIRSGESECFVKAEFFIGDNPSINEVLDELDVDRDDSIMKVCSQGGFRSFAVIAVLCAWWSSSDGCGRSG